MSDDEPRGRSTTVRTVTITADDFGLSTQVNAAIADLADAGRIHATSLLIDAPFATDALALDVPIAVGVHLHVPVALLAAPSEPVQREVVRQIEWLRSRGMEPAHLDLHTTAPYGPAPGRPLGIVPDVLDVAARYGLPLRLPRLFPPGAPAIQREPHARAVATARDAGVWLPVAVLSDFRPAEHVCGYDDARDHYDSIVAGLPPGHSELFLHPAHPERSDDAWLRKCAQEYALLASGELDRILAENSVMARGR